MARISGSYGQVKMDPAGGASGVAVASLNSWTLDLSKDKYEVTAFGDTNKLFVLGLPSFEGTFGGFWDSTTTPTAVFDVVLGTVAPMITLIPSTLAATYLFKGLGWLDGNIAVNAAGAVTIGGKFSAAGPWTQEP